MSFGMVPVFFVMSSLVNIQNVKNLTDSQLCESIGLSVLEKDQIKLNQLKAEGERRDRHKLTKIDSGECQRIAAETVNKEMQPYLNKESEKLNSAIRELERTKDHSKE
ncbi:TPA: hypothetical protein JG919_003838 [Enterobacter hormaechei subsp. steigerwaltii]|nr:hypothetical protein [Enterobacter hormaechei subsp. steigerwaltii]